MPAARACGLGSLRNLFSILRNPDSNPWNEGSILWNRLR